MCRADGSGFAACDCSGGTADMASGASDMGGGAADMAGANVNVLFSDTFDTFPSSTWVTLSATSPTLDSAVGNNAPSLAFPSSDTYIQTALVGPFATQGKTFSMDVSVDSVAAGGSACLMLVDQNNGAMNFGFNAVVQNGKLSVVLGGGCTAAGTIVADAAAGFHTMAIVVSTNGAAAAKFDGAQVATSSFNDNAAVMRLDGQSVHIDNAKITSP
jgi:hypothetical protein